MNNWEVCSLKDVAYLSNGFAFKSSSYLKEGIPVVRISDIHDGYVSTKNSVCVESSDVYAPYVIKRGDILIAMSGATTGKFGVFNENSIALQNQRVGNIKPVSKGALDNHFLYYFLYRAKREIEQRAYGGAQPNISPSKIGELEFKLPPLNEQRRIVEKIEELFSELDKGVENLKQAQKQLEIYRKSIFKHAFEGKLTAQWREGTGNKFDWRDLTFNDVLVIVSGKNQKQVIDPNGKYPIYGSGGSFGRAKDYLCEAGTTIIGRKGTIDTPIYVDEPFWNVDTAFGLSPNDGLNPKFLFYFCRGFNFKALDKSTTIPSLAKRDLLKVGIAVPEPLEQEQIVVLLEEKLSVIDRVEQDVAENLKRAEVLRQSILKKAFSGQLVAQDPNDEPASVLLERIRQEKSKDTQSKNER